MAVKKRGLGRGLDALLSGPTVSSLEEQAVQADQLALLGKFQLEGTKYSFASHKGPQMMHR